MMLVAFDSIFEQCSLAVLVDGSVEYAETISGAREQAQRILPMLDKALKIMGAGVADVQAWAFNQGPGAFSGIRINTAVVQALSVASGTPCIGVSSLEALAYQAHDEQNFADNSRVVSLIDARQNQVYAGEFVICQRRVVPAKTHHECLLDYDCAVVADAVVAFNQAATQIKTDAPTWRLTPNATHIARLAYQRFLQGQVVSAEAALPVYLRNNAWKTLAQQRANN